MKLDRTLVIASHGDDELIGAGGLLVRSGLRYLTATAHVVLTHLDERRRSAAERCADTVGYTLEVVGVRGEEALSDRDLVRKLDGVLEVFRPTLVLVPPPGPHQEHRQTHHAAIAALRRPGRVEVLQMEDEQSDRWGFALSLPVLPRAYLPLSETEWAAVRGMMEVYAPFLRPPYDEVALISKAERIGREVGAPFGERYGLLRAVVG